MGDQLHESETPPAMLDYASSQSSGRGISRWLFVVGLALFIAALVILLLLPALGRARPLAVRVQCGTNEKQLITAIVVYANQNQGNLPPTLRAALPQSLTSQQSKLLQCPVGRNAYVYLGAGLNLNAIPRDRILIYEPLSNHMYAKTGKTAINVAHADGSVHLIESPKAEKIIAELKAGHNPPRAEMVK